MGDVTGVGPEETGLAIAATANCGCGALTLEAAGPPESAYLCGCATCRKSSGGPFAWRARYSKTAVKIHGTPSSWRRYGDAGRWVDHAFCATCGTTLFQLAEVLPDHIVISAGSFDRSDALDPAKLFRGDSLPRWCVLDLDPQVSEA